MSGIGTRFSDVVFLYERFASATVFVSFRIRLRIRCLAIMVVRMEIGMIELSAPKFTTLRRRL
jgi:hypothetical protein